jgi:hypothetical protein
MKLFKQLALTLTAVSILASCNTVSPVATDSDLTLQINAKVNGQAFDTSKVFAINGRNVRINQARLYISAIDLIKQDGSALRIKSSTPVSVKAGTGADTNTIVNIDDKIVLFRYDQGKSDETLGKVPVGTYQSIRFVVGLGNPANQVNALEVSRLYPTNPLAVQTGVGNWWSWNSGYIFTRIQGQIDTSAAGTGTPTSSAFFYHIGGPTDMTSTITVNGPFEVRSSGSNTIRTSVDFAKFFTGIDLKTSPNCMVIRNANDGVVGRRFRDNQRAASVFVAE